MTGLGFTSDPRSQIYECLRAAGGCRDYISAITTLYARAGMVERMELLLAVAGAHWDEAQLSGGLGELACDGAEADA